MAITAVSKTAISGSSPGRPAKYQSMGKLANPLALDARERRFKSCCSDHIGGYA